MKKGLIFIFAVLFLLSIAPAAFCQGAKPSTPPGTPIKIGGSLPLTGIYSESAKWIKAAYDWWAEDINKKGGLLNRPVKLIIYDDESNTDKRICFERASSCEELLTRSQTTWFMAINSSIGIEA